MRISLELEIMDDEIAGSVKADPARFVRRVQLALAHAWPYAPTEAVRVISTSGALARLEELSQSWDVRLTSHEVGPSATGWRLTIGNAEGALEYTGEDLARVINAAWAGERSGRVS